MEDLELSSPSPGDRTKRRSCARTSCRSTPAHAAISRHATIHAPGPTRIEVFRRFEISPCARWASAVSPRSACAVAGRDGGLPASELRGTFSWARTSVPRVHARDPPRALAQPLPALDHRGLATWEEEQRNRSWTRNMRRDLLDARANGDLDPAARAQSCVPRSAHPLRVLPGRAALRDAGRRVRLPADRALLGGLRPRRSISTRPSPRIFSLTPGRSPTSASRSSSTERFSGLALEPRWTEAKLAACVSPCLDSRLRTLGARKMDRGPLHPRRGEATRRGASVDAQEALRRIDAAGERRSERAFLRGELALAAKQRDQAHDIWKECLDAGGRGLPRSSSAWARSCMDRNEWADAERAFLGGGARLPGLRGGRPRRRAASLRALSRAPGSRSRAGKRSNAGSTGIPASSRSASMPLPGTPRPVATRRRAAGVSRRRTRSIPFRRGLHRDWGAALQRTRSRRGGGSRVPRRSHRATGNSRESSRSRRARSPWRSRWTRRSRACAAGIRSRGPRRRSRVLGRSATDSTGAADRRRLRAEPSSAAARRIASTASDAPRSWAARTEAERASTRVCNQGARWSRKPDR